MNTDRSELLAAFDTLLQPERFRDYGPNGLQVEGCAKVHKIVSGVTASRALIEAAIAFGGELPTEDQSRVIRFANRVPLLFQQSGCSSFKAVTETNWRNYDLQQPRGLRGWNALKSAHVYQKTCFRKVNVISR